MAFLDLIARLLVFSKSRIIALIVKAKLFVMFLIFCVGEGCGLFFLYVIDRPGQRRSPVRISFIGSYG